MERIDKNMTFSRSKKYCLLFALIFPIVWNNVEGKTCPGFCTSDISGCKLNGGKILAYCKNGNACCSLAENVAGSCGEVRKGLNATFFKSPNFPNLSSGELTCEFKLVLESSSPAVKIDFLDVEIDGMKFGGKDVGQCDSDRIFIRGFGNWTPPPRCGNLTGYSTIIDRWDTRAAKMKTLSILALMSSPSYKWLIRITQSTKYDKKFHDKSKQQSEANDDPPYTSDSRGPIHVADTENSKTFSEDSNSAEDIGTSEVETNSEIVQQANKLAHEMRNDPKWRSSSVANGVDTKITLVPWQASLRRLNFSGNSTTDEENCTASEGSHFCGGSIINDRHVLSAAHCLFGSSKLNTLTELSTLKVVLGDTNLCLDRPEDPKSTDYLVDSIIFHYAYDDTTGGDDVLVIRLKERIKFDRNIKSVKLAETGANFAGQEVLLSGWGLTTPNVTGDDEDSPEPPKILQSTKNIFVEKQSVCTPFYEEQMEVSLTMLKSQIKYIYALESLVCTGQKNGTKPALAGSGDSGGALVAIKGREQPLQVGIVSYTIPTPLRSGKFIDFYQSVSFYRNWIDLASSGSSY